MIDTHCHLLPALDDGPRTIDESLLLARELATSGVTAVVCTPHRSRRFPTELSAAGVALTALEAALSEAGIEIELRLSAELSPTFALAAKPEELREVAIGGQYVLVELEPNTSSGVIPAIVHHLAPAGLRPILAHPERCRSVRRDRASLALAREQGAIIQVVANSLGGSWGRDVAQAALALLDGDRADVIASDAHRPRHGTRLREILSDMRRRLGSAKLERLVTETPGALLGD